MRDITPTYVLRRILAFLMYLLRRTPHPALLRHWDVRLDPVAALRSARAGEVLALPIAGRQVDISIEAAGVQHTDAEILIDGEDAGEQAATQTSAFAGSVVGDDDSDVRLTITPRTVTGYVRIGNDQYWIDPLLRFRRSAEPDQFVVYRSQDALFRFPLGQDAGEAQVEPAEEGDGYSVNPHVDIAVWSDTSFESQAASVGLNWWEAQAAVVNTINGFYQAKVGITFVIRWHVLHRGTALSSSDAATLLNQFGMRVRAVHGDIRRLDVRQRGNVDLAHLMTGRNLKGKTLGVAWQPGVWALSEVRHIGLGGFFGWIQAALSNKNTLIVGHELGHNFTGDHALAEKICVTHFLWCWDHERTIMWPTIYSDNRKDFSAQNTSRVSNNAQSGRGVNFVHP